MDLDSFRISKGANRDIHVTPKGEHKKTLIWMHGLGDSAQGFLPVFASADSPMEKDTKVRLLTAPESPVSINMGMAMNSWFDILSLDWTPESYNFKNVETNAKMVNNVIDEEIAKLGGRSEQVFVGGFSQGCAMALHTGLTYPKTLGGIIGLSGFKFQQTKASTANQNTPVFLAHGQKDSMIPIQAAQVSYAVEEFIKRANVKFSPIPNCDHEPAPLMLKLLREFVIKLK
jgi:phospholipase/carboxylesterase